MNKNAIDETTVQMTEDGIEKRHTDSFLKKEISTNIVIETIAFLTLIGDVIVCFTRGRLTLARETVTQIIMIAACLFSARFKKK